MLNKRVFHTLMQTEGLCFCKPKDTWSGQLKLMEVSLLFEISRSLSSFRLCCPNPEHSMQHSSVSAHVDALLFK